MEPETVSAGGVPHPLTFIFCNERGLRAGWRLLIFAAMLAGIGWLFVWGLSHLPLPRRNAPSDFGIPIVNALSELIPFLVVLFVTWVMSKIEKRKLGEYGLPLATSSLGRFFRGCVLWGFLPLTLLLLILRGLKAFYFGGLDLHGIQILYWAVLWGVLFLLVGLLEEYSFRGYLLHTLADGIGFWPAAIILAILFAWVHMGNSGETRVGIVAVVFFAMFASATLRATGNLWLAVGAHAGWDWGQSYFYGVNDSGTVLPGHLLNPLPNQAPVWLSGGSVGPEGSVVTLILWGLMTVGFLIIYQRQTRGKPVLVLTPVAEDPAPEA